MKEKLFCEECNSDKDWDNFIEKSENKNFFSLSEFLRSKNYNINKIFIKKNKETVASFCLFSLENKIVPGERIYTPINFKKYSKNNISSLVYKKHDVITIFLEYVLDNYQGGSFILDYYTDDLRPFYWHNFQKNKKIFSIEEVKYTSLLKINEQKTVNNLDELIDSSMFQKFSRSIKQQIKITEKEKFIFNKNFNLNVAFKIIKKTFTKQSKTIDIDINETREIYNSLNKKNNLIMFTTSNNKKEELAFCIFGVMENVAYYLNGGRAGTANNDYSLTHCFTNSIIYLQKNKINLIDLEGMNSPKRSFWKQGYGGKLTPYYKIKF